MNQSRLGADPLEQALIRDTRKDKPAVKPSKPAAGLVANRGKYPPGPAEKKIMEAMKDGRGKNYYLRGRKEKELLQKVLIYLPFEMVRQLKKEAIDEGLSLSAFIQKMLSSQTR